MEDEVHATSIELSEKNRQLLVIREEQTAHKASISCLQDQISEAEAEVAWICQYYAMCNYMCWSIKYFIFGHIGSTTGDDAERDS